MLNQKSQPQSDETAQLPPGRVVGVFLALLILALTLLVYSPAMSAGFVWDDDSHFTFNPIMTEAGGLARIWTENDLYFPLTTTAWWFARQAWGLDPAFYHLLNILLHALNAVLLWRLLARLRVPGAWLAGAVFALHPVEVQSVAWATELKNCQSGLFYLLALTAWLRHEESQGRRRWEWYAAAQAAFVLALASKTSTVTLPLALVVIHLWRRRPLTWRAAARWAPFFAWSVLAGLLTLAGQPTEWTGPTWNLSWLERTLLAARCVWFYLGKLAWPFNLSFVYPQWNVNALNRADWLPLLGWVLMILVLVSLWRRGGRTALLALAYCVTGLLPVLNFVRMYYARYSYVADHWQYLASMGAIAWGVGTLTTWARRRLSPRGFLLAGAICGTALLGLLGGLTWRQSQIYQDNETLWLDVIAHNPDAAIAYNNLGIHYIDQGNDAMAAVTLRKGLEHSPRNPELQTILAAVLIRRQSWQEARELLLDALNHMPEDPEILNNLGLTDAGLGRLDEAVAYYRRALRRDPGYIQIYNNTVKALVQDGQFNEARKVVEDGLRVTPGQPLLLGLLEVIDARAAQSARGAGAPSPSGVD